MNNHSIQELTIFYMTSARRGLGGAVRRGGLFLCALCKFEVISDKK